jgi:hypothetical protein
VGKGLSIAIKGVMATVGRARVVVAIVVAVVKVAPPLGGGAGVA